MNIHSSSKGRNVHKDAGAQPAGTVHFVNRTGIAATVAVVGMCVGGCTATAGPAVYPLKPDSTLETAVQTLWPKVEFTTTLSGEALSGEAQVVGGSTSTYVSSGNFVTATCAERGTVAEEGKSKTTPWLSGGPTEQPVPGTVYLPLMVARDTKTNGSLCTLVKKLPYFLTTTTATSTKIVADWDVPKAENALLYQLYRDTGGEGQKGEQEWEAVRASTIETLRTFSHNYGPVTFMLTDGHLSQIVVAQRNTKTPMWTATFSPDTPTLPRSAKQ